MKTQGLINEIYRVLKPEINQPNFGMQQSQSFNSSLHNILDHEMTNQINEYLSGRELLLIIDNIELCLMND